MGSASVAKFRIQGFAIHPREGLTGMKRTRTEGEGCVVWVIWGPASRLGPCYFRSHIRARCVKIFIIGDTKFWAKSASELTREEFEYFEYLE
ncbi:hypothetical protein RUM43_009342 [Polyplax serrata]|uniref:Uncharacterized protein n=1 Tax=Polyplax serrata TaxID=468196 RepID=A0AAN8NVA0_POLSC